MPKQTLLTLPPELRNRIYDDLLPHSLATFADKPKPPALLHVNRQLKHEYSGVFYGSEILKLDAYYNSTDSWVSLSEASAKRAVLEGGRSELKDLADFWSLASARRYCQHLAGDRGRGIMSVQTKSGVKRWMWVEKCE